MSYKSTYTGLQIDAGIAKTAKQTMTTNLTIETGDVTIKGNADNTSSLTIGSGAVSVSGSNTGDQTNISGTAGGLSGTPNISVGTVAAHVSASSGERTVYSIRSNNDLYELCKLTYDQDTDAFRICGLSAYSSTTLALATNNVDKLTINKSGDVSILNSLKVGTGTTNAYMTALFGQRPQGDGYSSIVLTSDNSTFGYLSYSSSTNKFLFGTDVTVNTGNLVIGTSGKGITSGNFSLGLGANGSTSAVTIDTSNNMAVTGNFLQGGASSGELGAFNTTTRYTRIDYQNSGTSKATAGFDNVNNGFYVVCGGSGGVYLSATATSWASVSDERHKDILEPIENALEKVSTLRSVIGKYKTDNDGTRRSFLIAQDVQAVLPEAVGIQNDELGTLGLSYTDVIPLLVAAIKELKSEIDRIKGV